MHFHVFILEFYHKQALRFNKEMYNKYLINRLKEDDIKIYNQICHYLTIKIAFKKTLKLSLFTF